MAPKNGTTDPLTRRIADLSPTQRRLLAGRIAALQPGTGDNKSRLVAYVGGAAGTDELRDHAREYLPAYMVPQAFVVLERLPRTPVGKVDRAALRAQRPQSTMDSSAPQQGPCGEAETILAEIWSEVLGIDRPGINDDFFELGGDSLLSIRILARARQRGLSISAEHFFANPTIAGQASASGGIAAFRQETDGTDGQAPLTPIQHWFFDNISIDPDQWSQSVLLQVPAEVDYTSVEQALRHLVDHHDQLRASYEHVDGVWRQTITPVEDSKALSRVELQSSDPAGRQSEIESIATRLSRGMQLGNGGLFHAVFVESSADSANWLLLVAHHLIVDALSWQLLVEDLRMSCQQLARGERVSLPAKTTSFRRWAELLCEQARTESVLHESGYWTRRVGSESFDLPTDAPLSPEANLAGDAVVVTASLEAEVSRALVNEVSQAFHARINEVLLTALATVLARRAGATTVQIDVEGHGREPLFDNVDISRTIGWFTTVFPVWLDVEADADAARRLKEVKEQLRAIPGRGMVHGMARYLSPDARQRQQLSSIAASQVCFNYLGQVVEGDDQFAMMAQNIGVMRSPRGRRAYALEINSVLQGGQLSTQWTFNGRAYRSETIEQLAAEFNSGLRELVDCARSPDAGGHTPSDFPLAGLQQEELDGLSEMLDQLDSED